jgi:hypothetical protein
MFQTKVEAPQREGSSIIEMPTILHTVHTSNADRLASKFVTLKTKHLVTQMLEDGPNFQICDIKNQTFGDTNVGGWP